MSENQNGVKNFVQGVFNAEENSAATLGKSHLGKYSKIAVRMFHTGVLTPHEMGLTVAGEIGKRMVEALEVYRTLYFVNVLKIDMTYVTLILTLIGIYDVLNNPLMGIIYDKTRTRYGKARPYIILAAVPYFLSTLILYSGAMFLGDKPGDDPTKIIFVFVMLFIQETFSTIYKIPRDNLLSLQTVNPKDRINVGLLNTYVGEVAAQIIYFIFIPLMELTNKGYLKSSSLSKLFFGVGLATTLSGAVGNIMMGIGCHERILLQPKPAPPTKTLFYVLKNKYALRDFIATFSVSWWSKGGYSWDVVTQQEIFGGALYSFCAYTPYYLADLPSVALVPKFQKFFKNNNRNAVLALRTWDLISAILMTAIGCPLVHKRWAVIGVFAFFYMMDALNNGPSNVFEAELKREIADYTEYVTGERPDGTMNILTGLAEKLTAPLNALLTVKLFKWSGYDPTLPMTPWAQGSKVVYQKVFFLFNGIMLFPRFIKIIPYFFYDLVGEKREKMYIALNERRALLASEDNVNEEISQLAELMAENEVENNNE